MSRFPPETVRQALAHLTGNDPVLAGLIGQVGSFRMKRQTNRYQALLRSIVAQQISSLAAKSIWARLESTADSRRLTPELIGGLSDAALRGAGISPQKLRYVRDLTGRVVSGDLKLASLHRKMDQEVIDELVQVKGIGVWTAQMFLMFSLGRLDVMPHGDLGIQTALRRHYRLDHLPGRETCLEIAAPWRPYTTVACWYLWRSTERG